MTSRLVAVVVVVAALLPMGGPLVRAQSPRHYPEGRHGDSHLKYVNGLPVLTVVGAPRAMGEAIGVLALRHAARMNAYPEDLLRHYHLGVLWQPLLKAGRKMVEHFPADYRDELEAMARGGPVARDQLVAGNTMFDLKKFLACSALLIAPERSATGGPLVGRNLDYPSLGYAHEYSLVTVYRTRHAKHAFATIGFPGLVGSLSGINDAGLTLAVLEVFQLKAGQKRFDSGGLPYALCYRRLLEECSTIAEAQALLEQMPRVTITNLVLADRTGIAVLEVTPRHVVARPVEGGTCVCTNHFCTDKLKPFLRLNLFHSDERYQTLKQAARRQEVLGVEELHRGLDAAGMKDKTMQTMIFEPASLRLHLAIGDCPSSAGELKTLELKPLFTAPAVRGASCRRRGDDSAGGRAGD